MIDTGDRFKADMLKTAPYGRLMKENNGDTEN
jgi:hypothetical protein